MRKDSEGMNGFSCYIEAWSAWMPGVENAEAWAKWAGHTLNRSESVSDMEVTFELGAETSSDSPSDLNIVPDSVPSSDYLPPRMRRRLSTFSKTTLLSVYQLDEDVSDVRSVFASQHGDLHTAVSLFEQIYRDEKLTPSLFTRSVFNANHGLFSIGQQNRQPGTAVSSGVSTFFYAMLDAVGQLKHTSDVPVLVSVCDEPLPESYQTIVADSRPRFSIALLLSCRDQGIPLQCQIQPSIGASDSSLPVPLQFLRWLLREESSWSFSDQRLSWAWNK